MNGRVYDYNLGRFMSVDPLIQSPTSTQSVNPYSYIMNNPLAGTDPTGYCSTGTHIKGKDVAGCSVVFDAGSGGSGKKKSEAKVTSNGGNNYTASFQLDKKTTLEVDFKINNVGSQGAIASGSGVGGYTDGELAKMGFAPGTRFFNDVGDPYLPLGMRYEQHQQAMYDASGIAAVGLTFFIPGPEDILLGVYIASRGAELTAKAVGLARGADVVKVADKWSRTPKSIQDQMALKAAQEGQGDVIIKSLNDARFKGMEKLELKVKSANGNDSVIHYVRDPKTEKLMDFKFKKHSTDGLNDIERIPDPRKGTY